MSEVATKQHLALALDNFALRVTIRFGVMLVASIAIVVALLKLTSV